jgi:hypothetical protein
MDNNLISEENIIDACNTAYLKAGHNAYFGEGFSRGVDFAIEKLEVKKLKQEHAEMVEALKSLTNLFAKEYDEDSIGGIKISKAKQLLNKIKENEN